MRYANVLDRPQVFFFLSFAWDVRKALELIDEGALETEAGPCDIERAPCGLIRIDTEHVERMDASELERPLILIEVGEGQLCIDGWHRIAKAKALGYSHLPALLVKDDTAFRLR